MRAVTRWWENLHGFSRFLFVALCVMVVLNVVVIFNALQTVDTSKALTGYSEQVAAGTVGNPEDAVLSLGDPVKVTGERCNSSGQVLNVSFSYFWTLKSDGQEVRFPSLSGTNDRPPGCFARTLEFTMPAGVTDYINEVGTETTWHIEGLETPIDSDGNLGRIKYWESTPFTVKAPEPSE